MNGDHHRDLSLRGFRPRNPTSHPIRPRNEQQMNTENNYLDRAKSRLHNGTTNEVARAQAEATLALAYEQRTANLIATFGNLLDDEADTFLGERIDGYKLAKQIQERLGL